MQITFAPLEFGQSYERKFLAQLWGYKGHQALDRGVITPTGTNYIVLFVTNIKQQTATQYNDHIVDDLLIWDGETEHIADRRIVEAERHHDEIHLFYREIHQAPFVYFGKLSLIHFRLKEKSPSEFIFKIEQFSPRDDAFDEVREHFTEISTLSETEQDSIIKSRLGQGAFRYGLIRLWGGCSITGVRNQALLRASHLKPWKLSSNHERLSPYNGLLLVPNFDLLLDKGLITFSRDGNVLISDRLNEYERRILQIEDGLKLRFTLAENREYLDFHREFVFRR